MPQLQDKIALVTGATSGIGRAIALGFAAEGARVIACGRDQAALTSIAVESDDACIGQRTDVCDEASIEAAVAAAIERFGRLDIAVNAAGTGGTPSFVSQADARAAEEIWRTNVLGLLLCMKHEARVMQRVGSGSIINVSSLSARMPSKTMAAYCGSKAAVDEMTRVAALELGSRGVRVNCIAPGTIATPMTTWLKTNAGFEDALLAAVPLGRVGQPQDMVGLAVLLAGDASAYITGQIFCADGGFGLAGSPDWPEIVRRNRALTPRG